MAYFDSPKNRAIWERELKVLREEKERRARDGYKPEPRNDAGIEVRKQESPFRRRISLKELELQESQKRARENRPVRRPARERSLDKAPKSPVMGQKAPSL